MGREGVCENVDGDERVSIGISFHRGESSGKEHERWIREIQKGVSMTATMSSWQLRLIYVS
jgi:hypothetical protein